MPPWKELKVYFNILFLDAGIYVHSMDFSPPFSLLFMGDVCIRLCDELGERCTRPLL